MAWAPTMRPAGMISLSPATWAYWSGRDLWEDASRAPRYREIAEELSWQDRVRGPPPRIGLPSELELQEEYEASRNTVRDAVKSLIVRGLVETRPGQGLFSQRR